MSSTTKLKVLLLGPAPGDSEVIAFCNKVNALHKSKAGPFDVAFGVGTFAMPLTQSEACSKLQQLPIPVYLQDAVLNENKESGSNSDEIRQLIEPNLFAFPANVANLFNITVQRNNTGVSLVVASCPRTLRMDSEATITPLMDKVSHVSYVGCDFLLTSHWPQGMENLANHDVNPQIQKQATQNATYDVAEVALRARARYHIAPASLSANNNNAVYWQSPPFRHLAATTSTQSPKHVGRLIALCQVSAKGKPPKDQKFVHALGIVPLHAMPTHELMAQSQGGAAPCPFTDDSYQKDNANSTIMTSNTRLSEAQVRRILAENNSGDAVGSGRWNLNNKKRKMDSEANHYDPNAPVDPTNTTLFVHGLHRDVTQQLQSASSPLLLEAFSQFGVAKIRRPPNAATTSFAFLEFDSHQAAKHCLETLGGSTTVNGVQLTLKWGTHSHNKSGNHFDSHHKRPRLTEADAKDSSSLYFRLPPRYLSEDYEGVSEKVRKWMETTLEEVLSDGSDAKVTAADEPALQVQLRHTPSQPFGFLDFASHAAASMALATLTGSTDGGKVECPDNNKNNNNDEDTTNDNTAKTEPDATTSRSNTDAEPDTTTTSKEEKPTTDSTSSSKEETNNTTTNIQGDHKIWGVALHWAHAKVETKADKLIADADSNFKFRRQHFPADARQDCWFCLASDGCEKHLITGVYHQCYAALPKGGIHKGHVLLIPVAHSSQGAFFDPTVSQEIKALQKDLRKHASEQYDMDLFIFERAIQTKGGYHTHVQCVPVERGLSVKLESTLRAQAKANGMDLREIQSPDLDISALLRNQQEDNDSSGYFYAEVPVGGSRLESKRFLYQVPADDAADDASSHTRHPGSRVPIQFGREVIAAVMGKPELAHWKSCVVDREEETKLACDLLESFQQYYSVGDDD